MKHAGRFLVFLQHGRKPAIERLYFHLEDEHPVYFKGQTIY